MTTENPTTRDQIVEAAYQVLAEKGYEAASIKEIAREAGIASGLVHYYFKSKDELLLEVMKTASKRYGEFIHRLTRGLNQDELPEQLLAAVKQRVDVQPEWYRLRYELFTLAFHSPEMRRCVSELFDKGRTGICSILQTILENSDEDKRSALASIMMALSDGLALQKLSDPNFDLDGAYDLFYQLIKPLLEDKS